MSPSSTSLSLSFFIYKMEATILPHTAKGMLKGAARWCIAQCLAHSKHTTGVRVVICPSVTSVPLTSSLHRHQGPFYCVFPLDKDSTALTVMPEVSDRGRSAQIRLGTAASLPDSTLEELWLPFMKSLIAKYRKNLNHLFTDGLVDWSS